MIRQLSVLVENKPGSLMEVTSRLTEAYEYPGSCQF